MPGRMALAVRNIFRPEAAMHSAKRSLVATLRRLVSESKI